MPKHSPDNLFIGFLFIMGFCVSAPVMDALAKYLVATVPLFLIVWARFAVHSVLAVAVAMTYSRQAFLHPLSLKTQIIRSVLLMGATLCFFNGLRYMPMASNLALAFIAPFVVTIFSPFVLGEKFGIRRLLAVIIGFLGVVIMLQPGAGLFTIYAIFPMGCGVLYAFYVMFTRKAAGTDPPLVTLAYTSLSAAVLMTVWVTVSGDWQFPDSSFHWLLLTGIGMGAMVSHFCLIKAFEYGPASALTPYMYSEIIMATILGFLVFGDFPNATVWLGIAVIISSGVYISWRERIVHKRSKAAATLKR